MCPALSENYWNSLEGGHNGKSSAMFARVTDVAQGTLETHHAVPKRRCRNAYSSQAAHRWRRL
jgi:hypothetical protein